MIHYNVLMKLSNAQSYGYHHLARSIRNPLVYKCLKRICTSYFHKNAHLNFNLSRLISRNCLDQGSRSDRPRLDRNSNLDLWPSVSTPLLTPCKPW